MTRLNAGPSNLHSIVTISLVRSSLTNIEIESQSPSAFLATQVERNFLPSGLREGHKSKNFLGKRECRRLLAWGGEGRFEMGWRGLCQGAGALLAAEGGSGYCSFAVGERGSWDASTLLGSRCVLL